MSRDFRDVVIEELADAEALLRERLASVEADRNVYREMAQEALQGCHKLTHAHDRQRERYERLLDEYRHLRTQIMRQAAA